MFGKRTFLAMAMAVGAFAAASGAQAARGPAPAMSLGAPVFAPLGYSRFCARQPAQCVTEADGAAMAAKLTRSGLIASINYRVNRAIHAQSDQIGYGVPEYWSEPLSEGRWTGDCEDYVLEKVRALRAAGVPGGALNIAMVTTASGRYHAVLLVSTLDGEYVLDNRTNAILRWDETGYRWDKRQIAGDPMAWRHVAAPAGDR